MTSWRKIPVPEPLRRECPQTRAWQREVHDGHLSVFAGPELDGFHLSISHRLSDDTARPGRYPTWDEIYDARYRFCPLDVTMVMLLPPQDEYVNHHPTTFHLWENSKEVPEQEVIQSDKARFAATWNQAWQLGQIEALCEAARVWPWHDPGKKWLNDRADQIKKKCANETNS